MRYIATFQPQAWQNDYAVDVDAQGVTVFDATDAIEAMKPEWRAKALSEHPGGATDPLKSAATAPQWIRFWRGPFAIRVEAMDDDEALELLMEWGEESPENVAFGKPLIEAIPDNDGRFGRGYRHALESMALALIAAGVPQKAITEAVETAVEAYGNNADVIDGCEVQETLVVSTAHLTQAEREWSEHASIPEPLTAAGLGLWHTSDFSLSFYLTPDDISPDAKAAAMAAVSPGFAACLAKAWDFGCHALCFDRDGDALEGAPVYEEVTAHEST